MDVVTQAVAVLEEIYHGDRAQRTRIVHMLVKAGIIEAPPVKADPRAPCPPQADIKAFKVSFFDNGHTAVGYRDKESSLKREFGLQFHVFTGNGAKVRSDKHANWTTTVPLWTAAFAKQHVEELFSKKQVCAATVATMNHSIERMGDEWHYGLAFCKATGAGSGWVKDHVVLAKIEDREPETVIFSWGDNNLMTSSFTNLGVNGQRLMNRDKPIHHARIAFTEEHADWATDARF